MSDGLAQISLNSRTAMLINPTSIGSKMIASTQVISRDHSGQTTSDRGKYDGFLPAMIIFPLIIAIWLRIKRKTEIPHCFAIFMSIFVPLLLILLALESDAPFKGVGVIVIALPLGWWIKTILKGLLFE